jgi:carbonic anhydrase/acetyltransferase-like protein (isoleucine patch superfamily)
MILEFNGKKPQISENAFVASNAVIVGDVIIEEGASIWFGTVIRGDIAPIVVGKNSNVQDNTVIHVDSGKPCIIGQFVTIGHSAVIHSSTINDNSLIGMGATILTGALIKSNCIVGANALVLENATIDEESIAVGMPAKTIRKIKDKELELIKLNAVYYVELAKKYKGM